MRMWTYLSVGRVVQNSILLNLLLRTSDGSNLTIESTRWKDCAKARRNLL